MLADRGFEARARAALTPQPPTVRWLRCEERHDEPRNHLRLVRVLPCERWSWRPPHRPPGARPRVHRGAGREGVRCADGVGAAQRDRHRGRAEVRTHRQGDPRHLEPHPGEVPLPVVPQRDRDQRRDPADLPAGRDRRGAADQGAGLRQEAPLRMGSGDRAQRRAGRLPRPRPPHGHLPHRDPRLDHHERPGVRAAGGADVRRPARLAERGHRLQAGPRRVDFSLVLAEASWLPRFSSVCSVQWSCRAGRYVVINQTRWKDARHRGTRRARACATTATSSSTTRPATGSATGTSAARAPAASRR